MVLVIGKFMFDGLAAVRGVTFVPRPNRGPFGQEMAAVGRNWFVTYVADYTNCSFDGWFCFRVINEE